ncbi:hypothetical protein PIROE2DRAFT_4180 [Piromyces sp. E2]|nr:hypothetical protein PIROE2DRAFT_4180 [Piromyces sp. E2]|eukprot:OUM68178.1 hypothetical protein PIROE2DRAFT_4180 [Piromyces sp. E2]
MFYQTEKRENLNCIVRRDLICDIQPPQQWKLKLLDIPTYNSTSITRLSFQKPHLNLGMIRIIRIRCDFENTTRIVIASNRVTPDCLSHCPCCGQGRTNFPTLDFTVPVLT